MNRIFQLRTIQQQNHMLNLKALIQSRQKFRKRQITISNLKYLPENWKEIKIIEFRKGLYFKEYWRC